KLPPAASVAPDKVIVLVPWVSVSVPPPKVPLWPFGVSITRPAGSVSVKPTPVSDCVGLGFVIVKLRVVTPPTGIVEAPKLSLIDGGATTVMLAPAAVLSPPSVELTVIELFFTPAVVPVTFRVIVPLPLAASDPPDRVIVPDPAVAV